MAEEKEKFEWPTPTEVAGCVLTSGRLLLTGMVIVHFGVITVDSIYNIPCLLPIVYAADAITLLALGWYYSDHKIL